MPIIEFDPEIKVSLDHDELSYMVYISKIEYIRGYGGSGPTYACGGEPPEPDEIIPLEGRVELDGDVNGIVNITSKDMDNIMMMTNENKEFFDLICENYYEVIEEIIFKKIEEIEEANHRMYCQSLLDFI